MLSKATNLLPILAVTLLCSSCAPIQLVSKYDEQTDTAASTMQKEISAFFVKLQTAIVPSDGSFGNNQDFYRKQAININSMELRAGIIPKNSLTSEQLQLVEDNLAYLALLHKHCVTGTLNDAQTAAVREKGVDASVACRVEYGASSNLPDQSAAILNPTIVEVVKEQFDTSLGAVMKLEMAKKRGEK